MAKWIPRKKWLAKHFKTGNGSAPKGWKPIGGWSYHRRGVDYHDD